MAGRSLAWGVRHTATASRHSCAAPPRNRTRTGGFAGRADESRPARGGHAAYEDAALVASAAVAACAAISSRWTLRGSPLPAVRRVHLPSDPSSQEFVL